MIDYQLLVYNQPLVQMIYRKIHILQSTLYVYVTVQVYLSPHIFGLVINTHELSKIRLGWDMVFFGNLISFNQSFDLN